MTIEQYIIPPKNVIQTVQQPVVTEQKTEWTDGWFKIKKLDLDIPALQQECRGVQNFVKQRYGDLQGLNYYENKTTNLFGKYNIFLFSSFALHGLFEEINKLWRTIKPDDEKYYLQSWLNVYDENESIGWHYHWTEKYGAWHGFFCVDVDISKTTYALQPPHYQTSKSVPYTYNGRPILEYDDEYELIDVVGQDGLLVMSPSAGDSHRNIPWKIKDRPRMTIAFDIVPGKHIFNEDWENHWIPLV